MDDDRIIIHIDGAAKGNNDKRIINKAYICIIIPDKNVNIVESVGDMTNNEAEWQAFIDALKLAKQKDWKRVKIFSDSQLVVNQFNNKWKCKDERMLSFYIYSKALQELVDVDIEWIAREKNLAGKELERRFG